MLNRSAMNRSEAAARNTDRAPMPASSDRAASLARTSATAASAFGKMGAMTGAARAEALQRVGKAFQEMLDRIGFSLGDRGIGLQLLSRPSSTAVEAILSVPRKKSSSCC